MGKNKGKGRKIAQAEAAGQTWGLPQQASTISAWPYPPIQIPASRPPRPQQQQNHRRAPDGLSKKQRKRLRQQQPTLPVPYERSVQAGPVQDDPVQEVAEKQPIYDGPTVLVNLPNELLAVIMNGMDLQALVALSQTCKKLRNLTGEEELMSWASLDRTCTAINLGELCVLVCVTMRKGVSPARSTL